MFGYANFLIVVLHLYRVIYLKNNMDKDELLSKQVFNKKSEKGPLNFLLGSLTSLLLCIFSYLMSSKIAIYFSLHQPSNSSEIVQSISSSINTLIIGLSFLLTFSFAFIGLGLLIVFIRSFFVKKA